jgi:hypothetical protein
MDSAGKLVAETDRRLTINCYASLVTKRAANEARVLQKKRAVGCSIHAVDSFDSAGKLWFAGL